MSSAKKINELDLNNHPNLSVPSAGVLGGAAVVAAIVGPSVVSKNMAKHKPSICYKIIHAR